MGQKGKIGTTTPVCPAAGTVPNFYWTWKSGVSQDSPTISWAFSISGWTSSTSDALQLKSFLTTSKTSIRDIGEASASLQTLPPPQRTCCSVLRSSPNCSFHNLTISPVSVGSSPLLNTACSVKVPDLVFHPTDNAPYPNAYPCEWWAYRKVAPCSSSRLFQMAYMTDVLSERGSACWRGLDL